LKLLSSLPGIDFYESDFLCIDIRLSEEFLRADGSQDRNDSGLGALLCDLLDGATGYPAESRAGPVEADSNRQNAADGDSLK